MTAEQDPVVARALADLPVPDHGPGFWERLDERLAQEGLTDIVSGPVADSQLDSDTSLVASGDGGAPRDLRTSTGELPSVTELQPPAPAPRRQQVWFAAAAAVIVIAASGIALALRGGDDEPETATGDDSAETTAVGPLSSAPETNPPTSSTATTPPPPGAAPAEAVAVEWLEAVGNGDTGTAASLTGPRSRAYVESLGEDASVEGYIRESAEGYGAMLEAPDLEIQELPLGSYDFGEVSLIVLSGTHPGEGTDGQRQTLVLPVVTEEDTVVEPWTSAPTAMQITLPEQVAGVRPVLPADQAIELFVPTDGTVFFYLDDGVEGVRPVETAEVAGAPFAKYDPPGELTPGDHVVVLGFVSRDGEVIIGQAVPFVVP
jgi:hypothetical protein